MTDPTAPVWNPVHETWDPGPGVDPTTGYPYYAGGPAGTPQHGVGGYPGGPLPTQDKPPRKRPFYKRAWFWVVVMIGLLIFAAIGVAGAVSDSINREVGSVATVPAATMPPVPPEQKDANAKASTAAKAPPAPSAAAPTVKAPPALTAAQENAVGKAKEYLDFMSFSRKGLIHQLEFEGYSTADARFAVNYVHPDFKAQAVGKAKEYLNSGHFSRSGLIHQLIFEGFTDAQATYGVDQAGL